MNQTILWLLTCHASASLACWGGSSSEEPEEEEPPRKGSSMLDPNNKQTWGGWPPPKGAKEAWSNWLKNNKQMNEGKGGYLDPNSPAKPYGHNIPGWPKHWKGLGPPIEGESPPPWAYVPQNVGKPRLCYEPPKVGYCNESLTRYGYNAFVDECQEFEYSGCGGNRNNFVEKLRCEQACITVPVSGCNPDSKIPVGDIVGVDY